MLRGVQKLKISIMKGIPQTTLELIVVRSVPQTLRRDMVWGGVLETLSGSKRIEASP